MIDRTIALILGGGAGSRLYPLTANRSKPAVPVGGKYKLIDIPISNCLNSGLKRMFVLTQFNSASLNQHIKNTYHFDHFNNGFVDILAAEQTPGNKDWFQGTADAVRQSMHHFSPHDYDYVLVLSGDQLYQMDFSAMIDHHVRNEADLTIATIPVTAGDAPHFGIMKVASSGFINEFIEKPPTEVLPRWKSEVDEPHARQGRHHLASMGIYLFGKEVLESLFQKHPAATDFGKEIIPHAIATGTGVASFQYDGYWTDIGNIPSFFEANLALTDYLPRFNLFDNRRSIYTNPRMLAPAKIFGTCFEQAVVAEGSIIHAQSISRSLVGIRSRIGERTVIRNAVIFGNDYFESLDELTSTREMPPMGIGADCIIEKAIIEKNCRIGNGVTIRGGDHLLDAETATYCVRNGIIILKKEAIISDGTHIGGYSTVKEAADSQVIQPEFN